MFSNAKFRAMERPAPHFLLGLAVTVVVLIIIGCGGNPPTMQSSSMGTINVSIRDPRSCAAATSSATAVPAGGPAAPGGSFVNVFVRICSIQANTSAAGDNKYCDSEELAPELGD